MIDTHQHLVLPGRFCYKWTGGFPSLKSLLGLEENLKAALAPEPNVFCTISGITACAIEHQRTLEGLRLYTEAVIEASGRARSLWGGDWPVVNLGSGLARWYELALELITSAVGPDTKAIFGGNAVTAYHLTL